MVIIMRTPLISAAVAALILALAGCSSSTEPDTTPEPTTEAIESTEAAPVEETPEGPTPEEYAEQFNAALLEAWGVSSFQEICETDTSVWGCYVSEIKPHTVGAPELVLQGYPGPMTVKEVATAAMSLTCTSLPDLTSVTASEATTGAVEVASRDAVPLCA